MACPAFPLSSERTERAGHRSKESTPRWQSGLALKSPVPRRKKRCRRACTTTAARDSWEGFATVASFPSIDCVFVHPPPSALSEPARLLKSHVPVEGVGGVIAFGVSRQKNTVSVHRPCLVEERFDESLAAAAP